MSIDKHEETFLWFRGLRDRFCKEFELIEEDYSKVRNLDAAKFSRRTWNRDGGGGGEASTMRGNVFAKVGVNISKVHGKLPKELKLKDDFANSENFFATGVSLVAHMKSPLVPAAHFNVRFLETDKYWFGGGGDLTPLYPEENETKNFHGAFQKACDKHDAAYYPKFKKACDEYFYLPHRKEFRGAGGVFFDYLNNNNFDQDFSFVKDIGLAFLSAYPAIVRNKMLLPWTVEQYEELLIKRGRYVEFNLLYDRGTKFGLHTGGDTEAILMSLPPEVKWS